MPNWCENRLIVTGPKAELLKMTREVETPTPPTTPPEEVMARILNKPENEYSVLDFSRIIPSPNNEWDYDWCVANWGTKWDARSPVLSLRKGSVRYDFSTAWSPPEPIVKKLGEQYPLLTFTLSYWEGGAGYQGRLKIAKGVVMEEKSGDYRGQKGG